MGLLVLIGIAAAIYLLSNDEEKEQDALSKTDAVQRSSVSRSRPSKRNRKSNGTSVEDTTNKRIVKRTITEEYLDDGDKTPKSSGSTQSKESESSTTTDTSQKEA